MTNKNLEQLIKECIIEVLLEDVQTPLVQTKINVYKQLANLGFRQHGNTPNEYMEYYLNGFATVQVVIDIWDGSVRIERFYDSEYLARTMNRSKEFVMPKVYSEEFVNGIVELSKKWMDTVKQNEPIYGGDVDEGFDPLSQGPNPTQENPYPSWNSKMRKM